VARSLRERVRRESQGLQVSPGAGRSRSRSERATRAGHALPQIRLSHPLSAGTIHPLQTGRHSPLRAPGDSPTDEDPQ